MFLLLLSTNCTEKEIGFLCSFTDYGGFTMDVANTDLRRGEPHEKNDNNIFSKVTTKTCMRPL
jgi:hypothetical protein